MCAVATDNMYVIVACLRTLNYKYIRVYYYILLLLLLYCSAELTYKSANNS